MSTKMKCTSCGKEFENGMKFCTECGGKLEAVTVPEPVKAASATPPASKAVESAKDKPVREKKTAPAAAPAAPAGQKKEDIPLTDTPPVFGGGFGRSMGLFALANFITMGIIGGIVMCVDPELGVLSFLGLFLLGWILPFIMLGLSKVIAASGKGMMKLDPANPADEEQKFVVEMVRKLTQKAGLPKMPDIYLKDTEEINAFATGPSQNNAMICFHTGLLRRMPRYCVTAVAAHEISHIANRDMVSQTLLQCLSTSLVNVIMFILNRTVLKDQKGFGGLIIRILLVNVLFMVASLVCMAFSRHREYKADASAASMVGKEAMRDALRFLLNDDLLGTTTKSGDELAVMTISAPKAKLDPWSTHPTLESRIEALK